MRDRDLAEVYAALRAGELDLVYAREETDTDGNVKIYATMRPRKPVLPNVTERLP